MVKKAGRSIDASSRAGAASVETTSTDGGESSKPQEVVDIEDASSVMSGISVPEDMDEVLEIPEPIAEIPSYDQQPDSAPQIEPSGKDPQATVQENAVDLQQRQQQNAPLGFMSPLGKANKKVKKKSVVKTSKATSTMLDRDPMIDDSKEAGENNDNVKESSKIVKNSKVKVIKKTKSPDPKEAPNAEIYAPTESTPDNVDGVYPGAVDGTNKSVEEKSEKSVKKLVKMKSSKKFLTDTDDQSVKSSGRPKPTKKKSDNNMCSPSLSSYFEKEALKGSTDNLEERSTRSGKNKKKTKSLSSSSHSRGTKGSNDEERSVRSGTKKVKRVRSKSRERVKGSCTSDDKSVDTTRSRSIRSGRKKLDGVSEASESRKSSSGPTTQDQVAQVVQPTISESAVTKLERENQNLLDEIEVLRQQLCDVEFEKDYAASNKADMEEMKRNLNAALSESTDLRQEIEECEEALAEKDGLIKKLTDAVDAQLDKVEYLELKLQRAEEEFCNMEDEMKEMEDAIEMLKRESTAKGGEKNLTSSCRPPKVESGNPATLKKIADMERQISELTKESERLNKYARERHLKEQEMQEQRDEEIRTIQIGINKQLQELDDENEFFRRKIEEMKEDTKSGEERLRLQIEELRKENTRLELASHRPGGVNGEGPSEDYVYELEVEIADLREKIVEHEEHSRRQKEEIALVFVENEEVKQDLQEREMELRDLEAQFSETKAASVKKMKQKDETILFMQTEMMRIMQEKQKSDKILREKKLDTAENDLMSSRHKKGVDEQVEKARLQAINDQLRQLDEENRGLEEKLKETQYVHSMRLKEKQAIILDLQEELNDAKWELGARKEGADYITLLKDRKERKRDLDKARKELKKAEERISDLEREKADLVSNKQDLEKEVESLNKSVLSMDSGEYVAGLKRQIKSLKQHNMALERKVEVESRDAAEKLRIQEGKVRILEHNLEKLKNPTRAALKSVFYSFGRKDDEQGNDEPIDLTVEKSIGDVDDVERYHNNGEDAENHASSSHDKNDIQDDGEKEKRGGSIWALFSPRRNAPRKTQNSSFNGLSWESKSSTASSDDDVVNEPGDIEANEEPKEDPRYGDSTSSAEAKNVCATSENESPVSSTDAVDGNYLVDVACEKTAENLKSEEYDINYRESVEEHHLHSGAIEASGAPQFDDGDDSVHDANKVSTWKTNSKDDTPPSNKSLLASSMAQRNEADLVPDDDANDFAV